MFCPECGKVIDEGVAFCPGCGAKNEDTQAVSTVSVSSAKEKSYTGKKGFFASLFDLSFSEFITSKLIKLLYILSIIAAALFALVLIISVLDAPFMPGEIRIATLIFSPLIFLLFVILSRLLLETMIIIFRIAEDVRNIERKK